MQKTAISKYFRGVCQYACSLNCPYHQSTTLAFPSVSGRFAKIDAMISYFQYSNPNFEHPYSRQDKHAIVQIYDRPNKSPCRLLLGLGVGTDSTVDAWVSLSCSFEKYPEFLARLGSGRASTSASRLHKYYASRVWWVSCVGGTLCCMVPVVYS